MMRPDGMSARTGISPEDVQVDLSEKLAADSGILGYLPLDLVVNAVRFRISGGTRIRREDANPAVVTAYLTFAHQTAYETLATFRIELERVRDNEHSWRVVGIAQETRTITSR